MTLTQLKYFQTICQYKNITHAAARLHVSQPSLSSAVKELEQEFGVTLFNRRSHGLELTPEGQYFLTEASRLLTQAQQLSDHMKQLGCAGRTVTLGLPAMSGSLVFPGLLQALCTHSPDIHIQVMESGSLANRQKVLDHSLDAAIITRNTPLPAGYGHIALRRVPICLYLSAAHPLALKKALTVHDLHGLPLAMLPEDTFLNDCILQYYHSHGLNLNVVVRTNQLATIQQLIANNTVASFLLEDVLEESEEITRLPVPDMALTEIDLIWKSGRKLSPQLGKLIAAAETLQDSSLNQPRLL